MHLHAWGIMLAYRRTAVCMAVVLHAALPIRTVAVAVWCMPSGPGLESRRHLQASAAFACAAAEGTSMLQYRV